MKKITLILAVLALVLASCQNKNAYTLEGTFTEATFEGKTIYLQRMDSLTAQAPTIIDTAVIKDNKFTIKGNIEQSPIMGFLSIGKLESPEENSPVATFILEPGKINVTFDKKDVTVNGTSRNDEFNKILVVMNKIAALYQEVDDAQGVANVPVNAEGKDAQARMKDLQEEMSKASFEFTKANMATKAGEFMFSSSFRGFSEEQLKELLPLADSTFRNLPQIKSMENELSRIVPKEGDKYEDVELMAQSGTPAKLSDYVGKSKCVLIDFWASWCGPCIQEMPSLVKMYDKYKSKGFEIVGLSVDEDKTAWAEAIKANNMKWVQLVDISQEASMIYRVSSIPHTILVDGNGVIIAKGLRGQDLENKIAEILN